MGIWWMVRGGDNNELEHLWMTKGVASIGWAELGDPRKYTDRISLQAHADTVYVNDSPGYRQNAVSQVWRFTNEILVGHRILTYGKEKREYIVGTVMATHRYDPKVVDPHYPNVIDVKWGSKRIPRDALSQSLKNSLGSTLTVFRADAAETEFESYLNGNGAQQSATVQPTAPQPDLVDLEGQIFSMVQDLIDHLDEWQMQTVVGGLLKAMGYENVRVSPKGPDGGVDVLASKDVFGFEKPTVKVQVKHRMDSTGAPEIQQLKGAMPLDASALFVSTGGFTNKALQAAKAHDVQTLNLEQLVHLVIDWYEKLPTHVQALVRLKKIYIPNEP